MPRYNVEVEGLGQVLPGIYGGPMKRIVEDDDASGACAGHRPIWALRGIEPEDQAGRIRSGFCGANGAGKSTLLKVLAGTTTPSAGRFRINGRVSSPARARHGLPHGVHRPRRTSSCNGIMMGFSKPRHGVASTDEIIEFAELGDYIDEPVRTYSSGMGLRLGFSGGDGRRSPT